MAPGLRRNKLAIPCEHLHLGALYVYLDQVGRNIDEGVHGRGRDPYLGNCRAVGMVVEPVMVDSCREPRRLRNVYDLRGGYRVYDDIVELVQPDVVGQRFDVRGSRLDGVYHAVWTHGPAQRDRWK